MIDPNDPDPVRRLEARLGALQARVAALETSVTHPTWLAIRAIVVALTPEHGVFVDRSDVERAIKRVDALAIPRGAS
jgi:hypothetical protein